MIAWINFAVLIFATLFLLYYYFLSISPAALERNIGPDAYRRCAQYRIVAMVFEFVTVGYYVVYRDYPLPTPLPDSFPWPCWVPGLSAAVIGIPSLLLMDIGLKDAGEEAAIPKKEHTMYGGIYTRIRHPQAKRQFQTGFRIANAPIAPLYKIYLLPLLGMGKWAGIQSGMTRKPPISPACSRRWPSSGFANNRERH